MSVTLQGLSGALRRFVAWTPQSALTPTITAMSAPALRSGVCLVGATEIVIAPQDLMAEANAFKALREAGGQATEPIKTAVVNVEDIYREFGYGSRDITAIRDMLAYLYRHATERPLYLLLFGGGHCDYQNHQTKTPNYLPTWESAESDYLGSFRHNVAEFSYPDDSYFGRLRPHADNSGRIMELAVGRVPAEGRDTAAAFVEKVRRYERASDTEIGRASCRERV